MLITQLNSELKKLLPTAQEISIAVALVKKETLHNLFESIHPNCKINIIVGIDLPTSPETLDYLRIKMLENSNLKAMLFYKPNHFYHPKIYIIKNSENVTSFVGSANLTEGGLSNNLEVCFKTSDKLRCIELQDWFKMTAKDTLPITIANIANYKENCTHDFFAKSIRKIYTFDNIANSEEELNSVDFSTRYFKKQHHLAFSKEKWLDMSPTANIERQNVRDRFLELNNTIYKLFEEYGIQDLNHNKGNHIVSLDYQLDPKNPRQLNAMWLSYGKSIDEISVYQELVGKDNKHKQTFIHHPRLQIRIDLKNIGIWILFGKKSGSSFDRNAFMKKMKEVAYKEKFFLEVNALPSEYWIKINEDKRHFGSFSNSDDLHKFCKTDFPETYFIIGRDYNIQDEEMSEENLPLVTLTEFKRLFTLYDMMKHRF